MFFGGLGAISGFTLCCALLRFWINQCSGSGWVNVFPRTLQKPQVLHLSQFSYDTSGYPFSAKHHSMFKERKWWTIQESWSEYKGIQRHWRACCLNTHALFLQKKKKKANRQGKIHFTKWLILRESWRFLRNLKCKRVSPDLVINILEPAGEWN